MSKSALCDCRRNSAAKPNSVSRIVSEAWKSFLHSFSVKFYAMKLPKWIRPNSALSSRDFAILVTSSGPRVSQLRVNQFQVDQFSVGA